MQQLASPLPETRSGRTRTAHKHHSRNRLLVGIAFGIAAAGIATSASVAFASEPRTIDLAAVAPAPTSITPGLASVRAELDTANAQTALDQANAAVADAQAAAAEVTASGLKVEGATTVDAQPLSDLISKVGSVDTTPDLITPTVAQSLSDATAPVTAQTADLRARLAQAQSAKAEADAAAAAKAAAAKKAQAAPASTGTTAPITGVTGSGDNSPAGAQASARAMLANYGWGDDQFSCLVSLWNKESGWNYQAYNAGSGATGIPQALPGSKMASAGSDWRTNAATQVAWGLSYISGKYGSPCGAWAQSQSKGWY
ncbi:hypothetical protein [uncultured Microbacterium sp.]|mgnify:CR=1 FL=1|uniref:aggregation-promoting factor C-terminal-like domain-containing protein n=1 Tax=uncultured Microbacterium sp. TaxID=191216 RepID=UPI0025CFE469|nr:hypothetical protein [uncultured Microbacterium sp.]